MCHTLNAGLSREFENTCNGACWIPSLSPSIEYVTIIATDEAYALNSASPHQRKMGSDFVSEKAGNFSFARAIIANRNGDASGITATAFDSEAEACEKYSDVPGIVAGLVDSGARVVWEVDARDLKKGLGLSKKKLGKAASASGSWKYHMVVFNFPHAGAGIKDQDRNVRANQELLGSFFLSAAQVLAPDGEVHVAVKTGMLSAIEDRMGWSL
eukprot:scaffold40849_cov39-Prasinocladus_malaysianus.AAC.1